MKSPVSVYVYYRVSPEYRAAARRSVMELFAELRATTGVSGRLMRRQDDSQLWMEIYSGIDDADSFQRTLAALADHHGCTSMLGAGSVRTVEVFIADVMEPPGQEGMTACA